MEQEDDKSGTTPEMLRDLLQGLSVDTEASKNKSKALPKNKVAEKTGREGAVDKSAGTEQRLESSEEKEIPSLAKFLVEKEHVWKDVSNNGILNLHRLNMCMQKEFPSLVQSKTKLKQEARANRLCLRCGKLGEPRGKCEGCDTRKRKVVKKHDMAKYFLRHINWD